MSSKKDYVQDRTLRLALLVVIIAVVQTAYALWIRPSAQAWLEQQKVLVRADPDYKPARSLYVIVKDYEQESAIIMAIWAIILASMRGQLIRRERRLLDRDLMRLPDGVVILPGDAREYSRRLEDLPTTERDAVLPRLLRHALKRFGTTRNIQDASETVHNLAENETARLDSELAMLRFCVWAIPALGFIGTVRGIGIALQGAELALQGDTSAVTGGLGISFNSTLIALTLSILLMFILHELQLAQERLVLDAEHYADESLISRLQAG